MKPVLILGIGNILLRDEGIGVRVVEALQRGALPEHVEAIDGGTSGADLIEILADRPKVIVVDAVCADYAPGTVLKLGGSDLVAQRGLSISLHQVGLAETLLMARQLRCPPGEVVIFGVTPELVEPGLELSPRLAGLTGRLCELVLQEAENFQISNCQLSIDKPRE